MTSIVFAGLSNPVYADNTQRIIVDLPLPIAALDLARDPTSRGTEPRNETLAKRVPAQVVAPQPPPQAPVQAVIRNTTPVTTPPLQRLQLSLADGQSLYLLFKKHNLSQADLSAMLKSGANAKRLLSRVRPGQKISLMVSAHNRVETLILKTSGVTQTLFKRTPEGYRLENRKISSHQAPENVAASAQTVAAIDPASVIDTSTGHSSDRMTLITVKSGDSLYLIFKRLGISAAQLAQLMASNGAAALKRLRPGQQLRMQLDSNNHLLALQIQLDETHTLHANQRQGRYQLKTTVQPLVRQITTASAVIESSLFLAGQRAGLSDAVIMQMVNIFGWDVDFALDIRAGDRFTLIYEQLLKDGKKIRDGQIIAAEFFNRGRSLRALRYKDAGDRVSYYSPDGLSMRKAFLRTPVSYTRISSRFSSRRKHPVLNRIRAHKGVDYAAPKGTPIKAAGDGKVVFAGWKRGYGKTILLQHGGIYSTLYGHMSRLNKRSKRGRRVKQGQIIGYVGQTGLATGPHLHYEFRIRGVQKNPVKVKLPKALPIERRYKRDFLATTQPLVKRLDGLARTSLAATP